MRFRWRALLCALIASQSLPALADTPRQVTVVNRIVAVVDSDIITLVELRYRAKPFLLKVKASLPEAQRAAAEAEVVRELLQTMIEERIVLRYAQRQHVSASTDEINAAVEAVAKANNLKVDELYEQAQAQGMDRSFYRDEITRQILRAKITRLVTPSRVFEETRGKSDAEISKAIEDATKSFLEMQKQTTYIEVRL